MKKLKELIEILKKLDVISTKDEFFDRYCCGDPLGDPNAINTMRLAGDIVSATAQLQTKILRKLYDIRMYADGFEETED